MKCTWIHEYAGLVAESGIFGDPRIIYDLAPSEIERVIRGANERERQLQRAESIRIGTVCACIYNQNRKKKSDKIWKWSDFFPDFDARNLPTPEKLEETALKIMKMFNGGI